MSLRIGIDLGGTKIEGIALDGSKEAARLRVDTPRDDYEGTLARIIDLATRLEELAVHRYDPALREPQGASRSGGNETGSHATIGIGIPGTISPATGLVKNANSTWLIGRPLQRDLEHRLGREIRIANDANCLAMSEAADGAGANIDVVFAVIVGTGVGGGIAVHGRILTGANGIAGEWGHNPLPWADDDERTWPQCYCGKHACIETFLSGPALSADHERTTGVRLLPPEIVAQAERDDPAAVRTMRRYESRMARALASVINVLDPGVIVLGGGMSNIQTLYANVPTLWSEFVFSAQHGPSLGHRAEPNEPRTRLIPARHGATSGVRGAAWFWPDVIKTASSLL